MLEMYKLLMLWLKDYVLLKKEILKLIKVVCLYLENILISWKKEQNQIRKNLKDKRLKKVAENLEGEKLEGEKLIEEVNGTECKVWLLYHQDELLVNLKEG